MEIWDVFMLSFKGCVSKPMLGYLRSTIAWGATWSVSEAHLQRYDHYMLRFLR